MKTENLWNIRQILLDYGSHVVSLTTVIVVVPTVIAFAKFQEMGFQMYQGKMHLPHSMAFNEAATFFYQNSVYPHLVWFPLTLLGDVLIRRAVLRVRE